MAYKATKNGFIYAIINKIDGMVYVGQTKNFKQRTSYYRYNQHKNQTKLYNATQFYGWDNFFIEIVEECNKEDLDLREKYWIRHLNTFDISNNNMGYNLTQGGDRNPMDNPNSRKKVSEKMKNVPKTETHKQNMRKPRTDLHRQNMSKGMKGKILSREHKENITKSCSGKNHHNFNKTTSQEVKNKISKALKGKPWSEKHRKAQKKCLRNEKPM